MNPKIMLFDEPTSALDPEMVKEVLDTMVDLAQEGMTMLCVTHEMGFARQVAEPRDLHGPGPDRREERRPNEFFRNPQHERTQAVPEPDPALSGTRSAGDRFRARCEGAAGRQHPGILPSIGFATATEQSGPAIARPAETR